ncbi:MAG: zinc permease [Epulopiscium sp. Nele67-Bin004]|nr:MAG: zinc permease [Epulopiscium sp. Nele67-Bin004]
MEAISAFLVGFLAEGIGVMIGIILLYLFNIKSKKLIGVLFGATAGIMISLICFHILPEAFEMGHNIMIFLGMAIGLVLGLVLEQVTHSAQDKFHISNGHMIQTSIVLLVGIAIHNIPEGFALGSIMNASQETILNFATIICLHSIPEAIAVVIPLKEAKINKGILCMIPVCLGLVMGIGAALGYLLSQINTSFVAMSLGMASGIILYIVCEELLPESKKIWNGRLTSIATVLGVLVGILMMQ